MFRCSHQPSLCWHEIKMHAKHIDVTKRKLHFLQGIVVLRATMCNTRQIELQLLFQHEHSVERCFPFSINHYIMNKVSHQMWPHNVFKCGCFLLRSHKNSFARGSKSHEVVLHKNRKKNSATNLWYWFGGFFQKIDGISRAKITLQRYWASMLPIFPTNFQARQLLTFWVLLYLLFGHLMCHRWFTPSANKRLENK